MRKKSGKVPRMGNNLRALRDTFGWTHDTAAERMGVSRGQFIKLERGERQLTERTINLAARAFNVAPEDVIANRIEVPIVGYVGADTNGEIIYSGSSGELGGAPKPPVFNDKTVAVEVRGTSMRGVAEDGWTIYFDEVRSAVTDDMIGELCILWLRDGRCLVKTPYHGKRPGRFDLESTNGPMLQDQDVESAAFVTFLAPRRIRAVIAKRA